MPEPTHPPYSPTATITPRQLQRWLDVNQQNGPLTRTSTYITLPIFNVNVTWKGYSEIVAAFNFEAPNAFSLTSLVSELPINPNYYLAISWYDSKGNHARYAIIKGVGEVLYFSIPYYVGQLIKKNFRLEVWSTNVAACINLTPINFYTSVLTDIDYRFGSDEPLKVADAIVTNFQNIKVAQPLPTEINAILRWQPSGMTQGASNTLVSWHDSLLNHNFAPTGSVACIQALGLPVVVNDVYVPNVGGALLSNDASTTGATFTYIVLVCKFTDADVGAVIFLDNGGNSLNYNSSNGELQTAGTSVIGLQQNTWYTIISANGLLAVFDLLTGNLVTSNFGTYSLTPAGTVLMDSLTVLDFVLGTGSENNIQGVANYFTNLYSHSIEIPITFPANAVSQSN